MDRTSHGIENLCNHAVQGGAIGADLTLEFEPLAHAHDGHAVVADGSRNDDRVTEHCMQRTHGDARSHETDAGSGDVAAVAVAALNNFCVAGDDLHVRCGCGFGHVVDDCSQLRQREAFFKNKAGAQELRLCAGDGEIVDGSVHSQLADRPAGKKQRLHDERIGAECEPRAAGLKQRRIAQVFQRRVAERGQEEMLHQLVAQLAAAAVAHHDGGIVGERERAAPVGEIGRLVRCLFSHSQPASTELRWANLEIRARAYLLFAMIIPDAMRSAPTRLRINSSF